MTEAKNRLTRFGRLLRLRQQALLQVEQRLGQLWKQRRLEQAKLNHLHKALDEAMDTPVGVHQRSHVTAWESKARFARHLRGRIHAQQAILNGVRERWQQLRLEYTQLKAKARSIELLLEKHGERLRISTLNNDQGRLDDIMLGRRHSEHVEFGL